MNAEHKFYESLIDYSTAIMSKCIDDSDSAVRAISAIIELLLADSGRISKMSNDTLTALKGLEGVVSEVEKEASAATVKKFILALSAVVKENRSVNDVIMPIVEALQFQDAIRQQMENMGKVMKIWMATRLELGSRLSPEQCVAMGERLLKATTMQSERDIIRKYISGLPEESKPDDVMLF